MFCHSRGIPIHVIVGQKHCKSTLQAVAHRAGGQVLCHPLAGLNQDVFPVSWVGWVSNEVVGLQRHIGVYFVGIPFHSPWVS